MKSEKGEKGKSVRRPGARRARSSKPASIRGISPGSASSFSIQPEDVSLTRMLQILKPHDHLCLIYESTEEWRACVVPFISIGLKHGEKCGYIVDTSTADEIRKYLAEEGVDVASVEKSGQLFILSETEMYSKEGYFDPDGMIALLISETEKAIAEGYPALRITGEMTWVLRGHPGSERLLEYEAKLNRDFFPKYPCVAICQYDRRKFDPEIIKGVIMTHPLLVRGNNVYHNFYYIKPEEFILQKHADAEVQHWLNNLEREQQIQETLRRSEYEKTTVLATMSEHVVYQDLEHRVVWANRAAAESVGSAPEDLIGRYCYEIWQQRSLPCVNCPVALARETGKPQENEASSPDGRFWLVRGYSVIGTDGVVSGAIEVTQDITDRKRAEEVLQESEEKYRSLVERANDGICIIQDGIIEYLNPRLAKMWVSTVEEFIGTTFIKHLDPDNLRKIADLYKRRVAGEDVTPIYEITLIRKDGSKLDVEVNAGVISYKGKPADLVVIRDITERKQAEEVLRSSEERFRLLYERAPLAYQSLDADGCFITVNQVWLNTMGYSCEEVIGRWFGDFLVPHEVEAFKKRFTEFKARGEVEAEVEIVKKDGSRAITVINGKIGYDEQGYFKQTHCILTDITERKRAEEVLHEEQRKLKEAQDMGKIGNWESDVDSQRIIWSDEVYVLYERDPALGPPTVEEEAKYYSADQARILRDYAARSIENGEEFKYDMEAILPSGEKAFFAASMRPIKNESGRVIKLFGTVQDITERKRADEALRASEARFRLLAENVRDVIWAMDMDLRFTYVSPSFKSFKDRTVEEVMSMSFEQLVTPSSRDLAMKLFVEELALAKVMPPDPTRSRTLEVEFLRRDGSILWTELKMSFIRDSNDRPISILGVMRDISERKKAEEERRELEQKAQAVSRLASVGEMAAGIAHEINNPLTSVIGYSQLLSGREDIPEDVKTDLKAIDEGAQRVAGIIKRLLTFARQSRPERTLVSINDLITNTLDLRAYHLRTNNIKVITKLATDLPLTTADPAQLQQVFLNIIVNAEAEMRQARGRGKLLAKTEEVHGTIRISFKDNGPGIAKKNLARIFDPFFTTREVGQGTGLGLSICHGIIAEHKGRIWAESKPGRGATFIVELPIVMESIQLEMAEPPGKKLKKVPKAKILVVDDEPSTLDFLSRLLTGEGHDVETVNNADEALEMVKNKRYSLILLDIKMPGTSGIELYGRMQKIALSLAERVIFITGDVMGTDTEAFLSKTKAPYITKPFDVHQLKKKIERFLTGD